MTEQEIRAVVEQVLRRLQKDAPAGDARAPQPAGDALPDIAATDLRRQYLVEHPHDQAAFLAMKERTPARIGVGHAGARYRTETMLRFQADHAAAQDAVFSDVSEDFIQQMGWPVYQTACENREEFLTRPDKGRVFPPETLAKLLADGKNIVFSSYRLGSKDIFITTAEGGVPVRLTDFPGNETPLCVLEGNRVLFLSNIQQEVSYGGFPNTQQLWQVDAKAGRPVLATSLPVMNISVNAEGEAIYEDYKGYEDPLRKHHTSSVTRDIWFYKPSKPQGDHFRITGDGTFTKLSTFIGEDRNPVFAADGKTFYYFRHRSRDPAHQFQGQSGKIPLRRRRRHPLLLLQRRPLHHEGRSRTREAGSDGDERPD